MMSNSGRPFRALLEREVDAARPRIDSDRVGRVRQEGLAPLQQVPPVRVERSPSTVAGLRHSETA